MRRNLRVPIDGVIEDKVLSERFVLDSSFLSLSIPELLKQASLNKPTFYRMLTEKPATNTQLFID
jgi:hypothetical protein